MRCIFVSLPGVYFKCVIVLGGYDICGGNVFQSLVTVFSNCGGNVFQSLVTVLV